MMQTHPCSGYLIEADHIQQLLPKSVRDQFETLLDDMAWAEAAALCEKHVPDNLPCPQGFFQLGDEDTGDSEMEQGEIYAYFDEADLYERKPKRQLIELESLIGSKPERRSWSVWS